MLGIVFAAAIAVSDPAVCQAIDTAITDAEKEASSIYVDGPGDDSAPRATMRAAETTAQLSLIQANIALGARHGCAPRALPIAATAFTISAGQCRLDIRNSAALSNSTAKFIVPASCDRANWKRNGS